MSQDVRVLILDASICNHIISCLEIVTIEGKLAYVHSITIQAIRDSFQLNDEQQEKIKKIIESKSTTDEGNKDGKAGK